MRSRELEVSSETKSRLLQQAAEPQTKGAEGRGSLLTQPDPLAQVTCRIGDALCVSAHAATLNRSTRSQTIRGSQSLLQLQRRYGNRYVQRVLAVSRQAESHAEVAPEVEQAIQRVRGGGQALDSQARAQMEPAFGADFSRVRVHADSEADRLNRAVGARAFTTGQDIFFRQGEYNPGGASGRELLAHELTHVVQQTDETRFKLTVSQPGDKYEQEASRVAKAVVQMLEPGTPEDSAASRMAAGASIQRMCPECDEEMHRQHKDSTPHLQTEVGLGVATVNVRNGEMINRIEWGCSLEYAALTGAVLGAVATCGGAILTLLAPEPAVTKLGAILLGIGCGLALAGIILAVAAIIKCKEQQEADQEEIRRWREIERRLRELEEEARRRVEAGVSGE